MPSEMPDFAVCVYCASGPTHPELLALAERLGVAVADRGWTLVSGGGNVSAMGAVAHGARSRGGRTVGLLRRGVVGRSLWFDRRDLLGWRSWPGLGPHEGGAKHSQTCDAGAYQDAGSPAIAGFELKPLRCGGEFVDEKVHVVPEIPALPDLGGVE